MVRVPIDPLLSQEEVRLPMDEGRVGLDARSSQTRAWCSLSLTWQRLAAELRNQPLKVELRAKVSDPALSQAQLLRLLPASAPTRLSGETDTPMKVMQEKYEGAEQRTQARSAARCASRQ